ncbi:MAG: peptide ABC transporter substrate-binding protein [Chloroflexota bacterium]
MKALPLTIIAILLVTLAACATEQPVPTPTTLSTPTPAPTATATSTPPPTPTSLPTATATKPAPPKVTIPSNFKSYRDQLFGFQVSYPPTWTAETTEQESPLAVLEGPKDGQPQGRVHVVYNPDVMASDAVVDNILSQFLGRAAFRTLEESGVTLRDGTPAFQTTYQWTGQGINQGALFGVTRPRSSQSFVMIVEGPQADFQANLEDVRAMLASFQLEETAPLGIPRSQALTLYFDEGPLILDPAIAQESQSIQYIAQIFTGLVSFDTNLALVPELAKEWKISGNGTVFTFNLRDNARFHNGRPVTASDFKYSWERAIAKDTQSPTAGTYLDDIVGVSAVVTGKAKEVSGIKVINDSTLQVTIDAPKAYFLSKLAHPVAYVVDRNEVEAPSNPSGTPWWAQPNGTGPFSMNQWLPGLVMVLDANKDFYGAPPKVPHVVFRLYGGIPSLMYQAGEIDAATVAVEQVKEIEDPQNPLSKELVKSPELSIFYVGFATDKPPFNDPLVRRAFLLATDREKLLRNVLENTRALAHGFLPPGLPGYNSAIPPISYDPKAAVDLITKSSYGSAAKLPPIIYTTSGTTAAPPLVEALLAMWKENLGVDVKVRLLDPTLYYYDLDFSLDNLFDYGWIADYPDPHNFLDVLFHTGADNNKGKYSKPSVDALLDQARVEQNQQKRLELYQQAEKLLLDDTAAIPLYFGRSHTLVKPYVQNLGLTPFGMVDLRRVSLSFPTRLSYQP